MPPHPVRPNLQQHQLALLGLELVVAGHLTRLSQLLGQAGDGGLVAARGVLDLGGQVAGAGAGGAVRVWGGGGGGRGPQHASKQRAACDS